MKIGCIADDFTGASDVCSFLIKSGYTCILLNDLPSSDEEIAIDSDVIVVAHKIRSIDSSLAIDKVRQTLNWFEHHGINKIYYKYASTFDSTDEGNIGPVMDYILERYNQEFTIISPALPENDRQVFNGYLFADNKLLEDGSMRTHPLNPMTCSYLPKLLEKQSRYRCFNLTIDELGENFVNRLKQFKNYNMKHFYIAPDYYLDEHGKLIAETFSKLKIMSGSSALISEWCKALKISNSMDLTNVIKKKSKALILSGSLSNKTNKQIKKYLSTGRLSYQIKADNLNDNYYNYFEKIIENSDDSVFLYSIRDENFHQSEQSKHSGKKLEDFYASLSLKALESGYKKIIVAGGETSGAVVSKLPYKSFKALENISPGVPVLIPVGNDDIKIVLKSGNFGDEDFFLKAIEITGGD